jgi:hypothetical protein
MIDPLAELEAKRQYLEKLERDRKTPDANFLLDFLGGFRRGLGGKPYSIIGALLGGGGAFLLTPFLHAGTSPVALVLLGAVVGLFWKWVLGLALFAGLLAGGYWVISQQKTTSIHGREHGPHRTAICDAPGLAPGATAGLSSSASTTS